MVLHWLSNSVPNAVLLIGALVEAQWQYIMKQDPNTIGLYESKFSRSISFIKIIRRV